MIIAPVALAKRDDATLVLVPAFGLLVVSVLAWLLLGPVRALAADGAPLPALAETILAMVVIGGLEGLFVTMIPLRFLDGATVKSWSFVAWVLVFATVTFLWWQLAVQPERRLRRRVPADERPGRAGHARPVHADDGRDLVVLPVPAGSARRSTGRGAASDMEPGAGI